MPNFTIALIVGIDARSYNDALEQAQNIADGLGMAPDNLDVSAVTEYDRLPETDERIVILPPPYADLESISD